MTRKTTKKMTCRLGAKVRARRHELGLTLSALSDKTGIHATNLSKLENGKGPTSPGLTTVMSLARALGVEPSALVDAA